MTPGILTIRKATLADTSAMIALARESPGAAQWSRPQYEIAVSSPDRVAFVSGDDLGVDGFVVARAIGGEWEIENIVVTEKSRRRGLGGRLLAQIIDLARRRTAAVIFLEVRESNTGARSFYEKNGFIQSGRRGQYYHEPEEDARVYRRELK